MQEPKWKSEHTSVLSDWGRNKQTLVNKEITKFREEDKYKRVTDSELEEAKKKKKYNTTKKNPEYNPVAELGKVKTKLVEKPTRDLSMVWKDDKKLEKENENTNNETQKKRKKINM
jgi:hypothetical protein